MGGHEVTNGQSSDAPERPLAADPGASTAAPHPEEMKAAMDVRIGNYISVSATARATPAGFVAAALLASAMLLPLLWFARHQRKR
jgi:hypothetical protein